MIYHVFNKSIANFVIFNDKIEFSRMLLTITYYQGYKPSCNLGVYIRDNKIKNSSQDAPILIPSSKNTLVNIVAYCLMPTHLHLVLEENMENGLSIYMNTILNSYTRYFNIKHKRKGPLWEGPSKKVAVQSDEQFLHLTRYIHLNPVTAYLVDKPEDWPFSSYGEYTDRVNTDKRLCNYRNLMDIKPSSYEDFVNDRISYQRELAKIKSEPL